jgi:hypothetical protein
MAKPKYCTNANSQLTFRLKTGNKSRHEDDNPTRRPVAMRKPEVVAAATADDRYVQVQQNRIISTNARVRMCSYLLSMDLGCWRVAVGSWKT